MKTFYMVWLLLCMASFLTSCDTIRFFEVKGYKNLTLQYNELFVVTSGDKVPIKNFLREVDGEVAFILGGVSPYPKRIEFYNGNKRILKLDYLPRENSYISEQSGLKLEVKLSDDNRQIDKKAIEGYISIPKGAY